MKIGDRVVILTGTGKMDGCDHFFRAGQEGVITAEGFYKGETWLVECQMDQQLDRCTRLVQELETNDFMVVGETHV